MSVCVCVCVNERKIHLSFMVKLYRRQCISTIVLSIPSHTYSDTLRASIQVAVQFLASQNTHNQITAIAIIQEVVIDETYAQKLVKLIFPFRPDTHTTPPSLFRSPPHKNTSQVFCKHKCENEF